MGRCSAAYPAGRERGLRRGNYCVTLTVSEGSDPKNTDPKNTHLNSFMFEPLVDMSVQELLSLYDAVSSWRVAL